MYTDEDKVVLNARRAIKNIKGCLEACKRDVERFPDIEVRTIYAMVIQRNVEYHRLPLDIIVYLKDWFRPHEWSKGHLGVPVDVPTDTQKRELYPHRPTKVEPSITTDGPVAWGAWRAMITQDETLDNLIDVYSHFSAPTIKNKTLELARVKMGLRAEMLIGYGWPLGMYEVLTGMSNVELLLFAAGRGSDPKLFPMQWTVIILQSLLMNGLPPKEANVILDWILSNDLDVDIVTSALLDVCS